MLNTVLAVLIGLFLFHSVLAPMIDLRFIMPAPGPSPDLLP